MDLDLPGETNGSPQLQIANQLRAGSAALGQVLDNWQQLNTLWLPQNLPLALGVALLQLLFALREARAMQLF